MVEIIFMSPRKIESVGYARVNRPASQLRQSRRGPIPAGSGRKKHRPRQFGVWN